MDNFSPRTDLALEKEENTPFFYEKEDIKTRKISNIEIKTLKKETEKKGVYITIHFPFPFTKKEKKTVKNEIITALENMIPKTAENIIIAGLGNHSVTADSIGPAAAEKIIATRGLEGIKRQVSVIRPEVEAKTGIQTAEFIEAITKKTRPDAVIVIDALAAKSIDRLFKTIQITDTGISPGSGVKKKAKEISAERLGIPVIAIGVPTVVDIATLTYELTGVKTDKDMIITPTEADAFVEAISSLIADAVNTYNFGEL